MLVQSSNHPDNIKQYQLSTIYNSNHSIRTNTIHLEDHSVTEIHKKTQKMNTNICLAWRPRFPPNDFWAKPKKQVHTV